MSPNNTRRSVRPFFYIFEPELKSEIGHYLAYAASAAEIAEKNGFNSLVFAHHSAPPLKKPSIKPTFRFGIWEKPKRFGSLGAAITFFYELRKTCQSYDVAEDSILFAPSLVDNHLLGWALFSLTLLFKAKPRIFLLLRYQTDFYRSMTGLLGLRILELFSSRLRIQMITDSHALARDYSRITSLPFGVVPIPHAESKCAQKIIKSDSTKRRRRKRLRFVSMGNARDEKGILEIFKAIEILRRSGLDDNLEFVLQVNTPYPESIIPVIQNFKANLFEHVTFEDRVLTEQQYFDLLYSADAVLLPYWSSIYTSRTSGPFSEAIAAEKPVVVSRDTWMSDFTEIAEFCEFCFARNPESLAAAIHALAKRIERGKINIGNFATRWKNYHDPQNFLDSLLESKFQIPFKIERIPARSDSRNAVVILPWSLSGIKLSGAGIRITTMLEFLRLRFDKLFLIDPDGSYAGDIPQGVHQEVIRQDNFAASVVRKITTEICYLRYGVKDEAVNKRIWIDGCFVYWFARYYLSRQPRRNFERFLEENRIHSIFVEYSFAMPMVARPAAKRKIPTIVTNYDVIAKAIFDPWVAKLVGRLERSAILKADHVVSITESDKHYFARGDIQSTVIPNSLDLTRIRMASKASSYSLIEKKLKLSLPRHTLALFLGSQHFPNIDAAEQIKTLAKKVPGASKISFVVAGDCIAQENQRNFFSLGRVEDIALSALYSLADFVIIPLLSGTGSSLKTIEAMALGKIVIGTEVAFRGLTVRSGVECIIENDIERYPNIIRELREDKIRMRAIGRAARKIAGNFDYRENYKAYLRVLGIDDNSRTDTGDGLAALVKFNLRLQEIESGLAEVEMQASQRREALLADKKNTEQARQLLLKKMKTQL